MTEQLNFNQSPIYTHPSIRDLSANELHERLTRLRNRRLVAALEFRSKKLDRLDKEGTKLSEQWGKLVDRLSSKIAKLEEDIDKVDDELKKLEKLSNQIKVLE